ncbi:MAG: DUF2852 domain-containing protein [Phaeovulum sp.]|uniref:DUF2852 domain-containing protein n=1 Tax=Phaeovulum sp. TaxID=2934796 RepID=UPI00273141AF|nr:DUF2852 domain-containing protein [Phaeovulum sp.]MDP2063219.1 DUF2852 domain-containing protein [Phaeovulum sp.]MDP3862602.1 DUF2852 domain-containing protein [Phaeovulum sp.]
MSAYVQPETSHPAFSGAGNWFRRTEAWFDARGRGAWIALMVVSFIFFWPLGLALLAYLIWSKRMFANHGYCGHRRHHHAAFRMSGMTGNAAFDAYKADTLARLEREQGEFEAFLRRLRESRDKTEFDQYLQERARSAAAETAAPAEEEPKGSGAY